jgi:hypothetical protein
VYVKSIALTGMTKAIIITNITDTQSHAKAGYLKSGNVTNNRRDSNIWIK